VRVVLDLNSWELEFLAGRFVATSADSSNLSGGSSSQELRDNTGPYEARAEL
jgi:hypothetical protein